jgi:1-aminocyclopropane-1-carboxylate deaminase/D-cysteine desulfhydrase-like pyridoxal-dependent ACC family enzyme
MSSNLLNLPSSVEKISFRLENFFLKRDDQIHPDFSGNKARKFHYFLDQNLPDIHAVCAYGSNQSNAMYSLSVLAKMRGWQFEYRVDHVPDFLRDNPHGNYAAALDNGMNLIEHGTKVGRGLLPPTNNVLWIEEGGRQSEAEYGIKILAQEILDWQQDQGIKTLDIFLPSGTGTTALYLQKVIAKEETTRGSACGTPRPTGSTQVYTTPCVGDAEYLRKQFAILEPDPQYHPTILDLPRKYHFGKLYREFYEIWIELQKETGVTFDLLYDPKGWLTLLANHTQLGEHIMYIHQGGLQGNESMLRRYQRKYT